jgi:hypothetical protein
MVAHPEVIRFISDFERGSSSGGVLPVDLPLFPRLLRLSIPRGMKGRSGASPPARLTR